MKRSLSSMKLSFTQVLLARARREWEWPTGGTEHRPVFHPSWFHDTNGSDGLSLEQTRTETGLQANQIQTGRSALVHFKKYPPIQMEMPRYPSTQPLPPDPLRTSQTSPEIQSVQRVQGLPWGLRPVGSARHQSTLMFLDLRFDYWSNSPL